MVALSGVTGTTLGTQRFDAFGNTLSQTGTIPQYGYTGREPDATGLIYYRARYYQPSVGRFTQRDPKGFIDGVNRYAYAINNPVNYTDPLGTQATGYSGYQPHLGGGDSSYYGPSLSQQGTSLGLDVLPVIGSLKSFGQLLTGTDWVTGEPVGRWGEAAGILLGIAPGGKLLAKGDEAYDLGKAVYKQLDGADGRVPTVWLTP